MTTYDYDNLNATEMVELAREHGCLVAHRGLDRQVLIDLIEGRLDSDEIAADPVDDDRDSMMLMKEEWKDVYNQLKCASELYACWNCPPARAHACAVDECEPGVLDRVLQRKDRSGDEDR